MKTAFKRGRQKTSIEKKIKFNFGHNDVELKFNDNFL